MQLLFPRICLYIACLYDSFMNPSQKLGHQLRLFPLFTFNQSQCPFGTTVLLSSVSSPSLKIIALEKAFICPVDQVSCTSPIRYTSGRLTQVPFSGRYPHLWFEVSDFNVAQTLVVSVILVCAFENATSQILECPPLLPAYSKVHKSYYAA